MEQNEYDVMAAVEDRHFWFVGTRGIVRDAFVRARPGPDALVLDIGCGTGGTMRALAGLARFVGLDMSPTAARFAADRTGNAVVAGVATALPFADGSFDGVLALDVIEHIPDDALALREARRVLRPGGVFIATVPCHQSLFTEHDEALHHVRRYSRDAFLERVRGAGLTPERVTWTNTLLFPLAATVRLASRTFPRPLGPLHSDATRAVGPFNPVFTAVFGLERRLLRRTDMPFGLGLLVVAR